MSRVITFSDGFTSSSAPSVSAGTVEAYPLLNNVTLTEIPGLIFESENVKSVFIDYEIERIGSSTYRQAGVFQAVFNDTWSLSFANYQGDSILDTDLETDYSMYLAIEPTDGQILYVTSDQDGHISSEIKLNILKVSV
jgi:hypothetical protein